MASKIEWTDCTWQVTHGCEKVSPGCANCYAIRDVHRMAGNPNPVISDPRKGKTHRVGNITDWTGVVTPAPQNLAWPLRKKKGKRIFVNSNSDLFHKDVPFQFIAAVFGVMAATPQHTYQVLTKRPARMLEFFKWAYDNDGVGDGVNVAITEMFGYDGPNAYLCKGAPDHHDDDSEHISCRLIEYPPEWPLANVWIGVSVENQETADERIPALLKTPAALRFVSYEPALGPVDFDPSWCPQGHTVGSRDSQFCDECGDEMEHQGWLTGGPLGPIDWLIVGGESGSKARPCNMEWVRDAVQQCDAASVPIFVKQLGAKPCYFPGDEKTGYEGIPQPVWISDKKGGTPRDWPEDLRVRQFPKTGVKQ